MLNRKNEYMKDHLLHNDPSRILIYRDSIYASDWLVCAIAYFDFFAFLNECPRTSITSFQNMVVSPVFMEQVVMALMKLITGDGSGMFHLSGDEDISYADRGYCLTNQIGVSPDRVLPVSADPSLLPKGALPRNTTLDMTRSRLELGIEGREIRHVIHQVIKEEHLQKMRITYDS